MERIRVYVEEAFAEAPRTKKVLELKEELIANLFEKYQDLISRGMSESDCFQAVINSIGDVSELIESVREPELEPLSRKNPKETKTRAMLIVIAVILYIMSPAVFLVCADTFGMSSGAIAIMFFCIAAASGLMVYCYMTRPVYTRADDTIVEDFKEWSGRNQRRQAAMASFKSAYWAITAAIYLLVSFIFGAWFFSWILFIAAAAGWQIISGIVELKGGGK